MAFLPGVSILAIGGSEKGWLSLVILIAVFMSVRVLAYGQGADMRDIAYWSILGRIDQFLIGMLAGIYYRNRFQESSRFDWVAIVGIIGVLASLFIFNQFGGGGLNNSVWIYWTTLEGAAVINVFLVVMPLVIAISAVTYYCIERPFLRRRATYV